MTRHATGISRYSKATGLALALAAAPAAAQEEAKNVRDRTPGMVDIAATPVQDLNLTRDEIPEALTDAVVAPYASEQLTDCAALGREIARLDAVLGPDLDIETEDRDDLTLGKAAKSVVGSLIPLRGVIREITGAASHQRKFENAIYAGAVRRGYLKGLGEQRGCAYPARPAFARVSVGRKDRVEASLRTEPQSIESQDAKPGKAETRFVSAPVIQQTGD